MVKISVIIPSFNQPNKIAYCIKSILEQNFSKEYEVIIVDSSDPKHQSKIKKMCSVSSKIKLIKLEKQTYPGIARNIGIKESVGNIIALLDADCVADKNWLHHIYKNITDNVILTGVISNGTKKSIMGTCAYLVEFNNFLALKKEKREIRFAGTLSFACKRDVFEKVGFFSGERAFEDVLFCQKFRKLGGKIYQIKRIIIEHLNRAKFSEVVSNLRMLGKYSAKVRRYNDMPPKLIFNYPFLAFGLVGYRYIGIFFRTIKSNFFIQYLLYTPIIILCLIHWSIGFYMGAKED